MSTDLDQLFAEARSSALPPSRVDLDRVVARGRRRRATVRAREGATIALAGAVVVGGGAFALSGGTLESRAPVQSGSDGTGTASATASTPASSAEATKPPISVTITASPEPTQKGSDGSSPTDKPSFTPTTVNGKQVLWAGEWPAGLELITLPDVDGFGPGRRFPDALEPNNDLNAQGTTAWTATIGIGQQDGSGPSATVFVGDFPPPTAGSNARTLTVRGRSATEAMIGGQRILYLRTDRWAIEVISPDATSAQIVAVAEALQNVD